MVGIDANGILFIYDAGNYRIKMMDTNDPSLTVKSMVSGACRVDYMAPDLDLPFGIKLRSMICYKAWLLSVV